MQVGLDWSNYGAFIPVKIKVKVKVKGNYGRGIRLHRQPRGRSANKSQKIYCSLYRDRLKFIIIIMWD